MSIDPLITRFHDALPTLKRGNYNETEVRVQFINPLFEALGWDMADRSGRGEVKHEDKIAIAGKAKAPDYGFYLDNRRRFFVEAKKPSVNLAADAHPAFQLRRYAWTAKLPLSVLTDFEEFAVYDTRVRPTQGDAPTVARLRYWRYDQYESQWADIAALFGRDAVLAGSLEQFAAAEGGRKGIATVDADFLAQLNAWRDRLAHAIAARNPSLSGRDLNFAVQQTLDRLIFLRIAEDRAIEPYGRLRDLTTGPGTFDRLLRLFFAADARYNSGLFHFRHERPGDAPDMVSPRLTIDDQPLQEIILALYEPISPYEFSVFPADILGQVYEQFLGNVIRLETEFLPRNSVSPRPETEFLLRNSVSKPPTPRIVIEQKPEVRKAGGVYYTPTYIVDYIVRQTVGRLLAGHTPDPTGPVARLRVLDPACGSGSFLLGAYQFLLDWHLDGYRRNVKKWARKRGGTLVQTANDDYVLTLAERKRILLDNLYGVDIDPQAVEVTKLSLLLKVLEGAAAQLGPQAALLGERVLPDLDNNVKCGNSLIGPDFYDRPQPSLLGDDEMLRVNAFDWRAEFPAIMSNGGFDAVIGNPPYIRIQTMEREEIRYFTQYYETTIGNYDIYCPFIEKALKLLSSHGLASFIVPHRFFKTDYGSGLRAFIAKGRNLAEVVDFDGYMVFPQASINTCIVVLSRDARSAFKYTQVKFIRREASEMPEIMARIGACESLRDSDLVCNKLPIQLLTDAPWVFVLPEEQALWNRLSESEWNRLGNVATQIFQGLKTGGDSVFSVEVVENDTDLSTIKSGDDVFRVENALLYPQIKGGEMKRYRIGETKRAVIFPYESGKLIEASTLQARFPLLWKYLKAHQKYLESRESGKMKGSGWYGYTRNQALTSMQQPKIVTPDYYAHASYALDEDGRYFFFGGGAGGYGIVLKPNWNHYFLLGLLNSRLLDWYLRKISVRQYQTAFSYVKCTLSLLSEQLVFLT